MKKRWVTKSEISLLLFQNGYGVVSVRQVDMWYVRRANNGFPEMKGTEERRRGVLAPVFDPDEVLRWRKSYVPARGGRPRVEMTDDRRAALRADHHSGMRYRELVAKYGISQTHVSRLVRGVAR